MFRVYAKFPFVQILPLAPIAAIVKSISHSQPKPVVGLKEIVPVVANTVAPLFILIVISSPFCAEISPPIQGYLAQHYGQKTAVLPQQ